MDGNIHGCFSILNLAHFILDGMVRIIQRGITIPRIPIEKELCSDIAGILFLLPFINSKSNLKKCMEINGKGSGIYFGYISMVGNLLKCPFTPFLGRRCRFLSMGNADRKNTNQKEEGFLHTGQ